MAVKKDEKTGKWYYYGKYKNILGEKKQYKKRGFRTKSEALAKEQIFLMSVKDNTSTLTLENLFNEFIIYSESRKKLSTINVDRRMYRLYIQPYFGSKNYKDVTTKDIIRWQNHLKNELKLSPVNINCIMKSFSKLYNYATKIYLSNYNPISIVGKLKEPKREYITWNEIEFNKFFTVIEEKKYKVAFRLLYFTGIRRGEFLALQWNDYNGKSINICKTCSHVKGSYMITEPKTRNSYRTIELDYTTNQMMKDWKKEMEQYDGYNKDWYIFGNLHPMPFNKLGRVKDKYIDKSGVSNIRLHDFRHSHISLLINNNVPLPAIAARAGDTIDTIINTYAHLFEKSNKELIDLLNKF